MYALQRSIFSRYLGACCIEIDVWVYGASTPRHVKQELHLYLQNLELFCM